MDAFAAVAVPSPSLPVMLTSSSLDAQQSSASDAGGPSSSTSSLASSPSSRRKETNAVNRSWSDVDPIRLIGTFGLTSFTSSVLLHPAYLVVARQQCQQSVQPVGVIVRETLRQQGLRGLYRGVGVSTVGTVLVECLYFAVLEKAKEALPIESKSGRDFGAGLAADGLTGPMYVPFAIISQRQMVGAEAVHPTSTAASSSAKQQHVSGSYRSTAIARSIVEKDGYSALFRGTLLSLAMMPVGGCWWVVYEKLKGSAYGVLQPPTGDAAVAPSSTPAAAAVGTQGSQRPWRDLLASRTDNPLVNAAVGGVTGGLVTVVLNPLHVVRARLQVLAAPTASAEAASASASSSPASLQQKSRWRASAVAKDVFAREGFAGFTRGLRVNMAMGIGGSMLFSTFYELSKCVADVN